VEAGVGQDAGLEVVLVEPGSAGAANARRRGIRHVVCAALEDAGFIPASLPAISLFDVVEHMKEDYKSPPPLQSRDPSRYAGEDRL